MFVPVQPTLPCMINRSPRLKDDVKKAVEYARKLEEGDFDSLYNTEGTENSKRFISKIDLLRNKKLKNETWFKHILEEVQDQMGRINKDLEIDKSKLLKSIKGCQQQDFHTDNDQEDDKKRYSIIFSLMEGTSVVFKEANDPDDFGWSLQMPEASMVIFRDESFHAGGAYNQDNFRLFFTASLKEKKRKRKNIYGTGKCKPKKEEIYVQQQTTVDGNLCPGCGMTILSKKGTKDNGKSARAKHIAKCVEYLVMKGMSEENAKKQRREKLDKGRKATADCRERRKVKAEQEEANKAERLCKGKTEEEAENQEEVKRKVDKLRKEKTEESRRKKKKKNS